MENIDVESLYKECFHPNWLKFFEPFLSKIYPLTEDFIYLIEGYKGKLEDFFSPMFFDPENIRLAIIFVDFYNPPWERPLSKYKGAKSTFTLRFQKAVLNICGEYDRTTLRGVSNGGFFWNVNAFRFQHKRGISALHLYLSEIILLYLRKRGARVIFWGTIAADLFSDRKENSIFIPDIRDLEQVLEKELRLLYN